MPKIAIMTDSNSGITQAEGKQLGVHVLPMPFTVGGQDFYEDINLTQEQFYEFLERDLDVQTSQPSPAVVTDTFQRLLGEYDQVIHIPMSSGLSGSCQTAWMLADQPEFEGKVFVIDNQRISVTQRQSVLDALAMAEKGLDGSQIAEKLMEDKFNSSIYIMMDTLTYLKKGGRITPAAAAVGTLLKIKPVLTIQGEKLDAFAKARTPMLGKKIMIDAMKKDIDQRFGGLDENAGKRVTLQVAYSKDFDKAQEFCDQVMEAFPGFEKPVIMPLSLSVACHIGPGALAIACTQNLEV
ncbi:MAG: DegV family protein [Lachnospiraceae bacterium]|nr:DegV family protein [Lachnospiraceae bacterium]